MKTTESCNCRVCGRPAEIDDLSRYPYACGRCISKNFDKMVRAQNEAIRLWEETSRNQPAPHQDTQKKTRDWIRSIRRGLDAMRL